VILLWNQTRAAIIHACDGRNDRFCLSSTYPVITDSTLDIGLIVDLLSSCYYLVFFLAH